MPSCPNCGLPVAAEDAYCRDCGIELSITSQADSRESRQDRIPQDESDPMVRHAARTTQASAAGRRDAEPSILPGKNDADESETDLPRQHAFGSIWWGITVIRKRPELVVLMTGAGLLLLLATPGMTVQETAFGPETDVAPWALPVLVAWMVADTIVGAAILFAGYDEAVKRSRNLAALLSDAISRTVSLIITMLLFTVVTGLGYLFLVLPGIYLSVRLSLAFPACVIDRMNPFDSLRRGWSTSMGRFWKIFGVNLTFLVVGYVVDTILRLELGVVREGTLPADPPSVVIFAITGGIFFPIYLLALTRIYLEGEQRMERASQVSGIQQWPSWRNMR